MGDLLAFIIEQVLLAPLQAALEALWDAVAKRRRGPPESGEENRNELRE